MKSVSSEEKVCNACRTAYYIWKNNNPEFGNLFSRVEEELSDVEGVANTNSVMDKAFFSYRIHILMYLMFPLID